MIGLPRMHCSPTIRKIGRDSGMCMCQARTSRKMTTLMSPSPTQTSPQHSSCILAIPADRCTSLRSIAHTTAFLSPSGRSRRRIENSWWTLQCLGMSPLRRTGTRSQSLRLMPLSTFLWNKKCSLPRPAFLSLSDIFLLNMVCMSHRLQSNLANNKNRRRCILLGWLQ